MKIAWKAPLGLLAALVVWGGIAFGQADAASRTVLYLPLDDRPYSLDRVLEVAESLDARLLLPPYSFFRGRDGIPDFEGLYGWLAAHRQEGPAVIAADAFLFGGLVSSRTHDLGEEETIRRLEALRDLASSLPGKPFSLFGTLLRLPRQSEGILDAGYNAKWAPHLFQLARLESAASRGVLEGDDLAASERLLKAVPPEVLREWANRRNRSLRAALRLLRLYSHEGIGFVGIGLDDNVSPTWLEQEFQSMERIIADVPTARAAVVPGVDQLGLLLFGKILLEDKETQKVHPFFPVRPGSAANPTYSGFTPRQSLEIQSKVLGVRLAENPWEADLVLVVNTPAQGWTREASSSSNRPLPDAEDEALAEKIGSFLEAGKPVALADVAFDNGADNGLMEALRRRGLLGCLAAYSGGNTSDNAIGLALVTGTLARWMPASRRKRILFTRLLDEWGYQANVRAAVIPRGAFGGQVSPARLEKEIYEKLAAFSGSALAEFGTVDFEVSYPWGRLFEIRITGRENAGS